MVYHLMEYFWAMKMEFTTALYTKSHEQQIKKPDTKGYKVCNATYTKSKSSKSHW